MRRRARPQLRSTGSYGPALRAAQARCSLRAGEALGEARSRLIRRRLPLVNSSRGVSKTADSATERQEPRIGLGTHGNVVRFPSRFLCRAMV